MVTLGQIGIWIGYGLLGLFVLTGYIAPAAILLAKWFANKGWQDVEDAEPRVSLFTVRAGWRTTFSYLFIFKMIGMALIWTLPEVSADDTYDKVSQIAAGKIAMAIPAAMALAYATLEGVGGIMVVLDFYAQLKRKERRRLKAEAEQREAKIKAESEQRQAKIKAESEQREAEIKAESEQREAQLRAQLKAELDERDERHAAEVSRLNAEIERLKKRNGHAD